jgi:hypothetical protein
VCPDQHFIGVYGVNVLGVGSKKTFLLQNWILASYDFRPQLKLRGATTFNTMAFN